MSDSEMKCKLIHNQAFKLIYESIDVICVNLLIAFDNSAGHLYSPVLLDIKLPGILIPLDSRQGNIWR